ncbi:MAG: translocation/assembly module TamB domain-containing protein [Bacteroidota bacterium]
MKKRIGRILVFIWRTLLGLIVASLVTLQVPYVQNKLFARLLLHLSHITQFAITHEQFQMRWFCYGVIKGLKVQDPDRHEMLSAHQIKLQVNPLRLLIRPRTALKQITVEEAQLQLRKNKTGILNIALLGTRLTEYPGNTCDKGSHTTFPHWIVQSATFRNCQLILYNPPAALQQLSDTTHSLHLHDLTAQFDQLQLRDDAFQAHIKHLSGRHAQLPLVLKQLSGTASVTPQSIELQSLVLQTAQSYVQGHVHVTYNQLLQARNWAKHLKLKLRMQKMVLASEELGYFVPYFQQHKAQYRLSGQVAGPVSDLQLVDCEIGFGKKNSSLQGGVRLFGLPRPEDVHFSAVLQQGTLHAADLQPYISEPLHQTVTKLDRIQLKGSFGGTAKNIQVAATFDTDLGQLITDVELSGQEAFPNIAYKGTITTADFDLGTLCNYPALQRISMQGRIDGKGCTLDTAHFQLEGHVDKLTYQRHTYEHVYTHGQFARRFFRGKLTIKDPLLKLQADASIDLNATPKVVSVKGDLQQASLKALRLTPYPATLAMRFKVALTGLAPDNLQADLQLEQALLKQSAQVLYLKHLRAQVDNTLGHSTLALDSDWLNVQASGDVTCTQLIKDLQQFVKSYQERLSHIPPKPRKAEPTPYTYNYRLHCKDLNPLLHTIAPNAFIAPDTMVKGSFTQAREAVLQLHIPAVASLKWNQYQWRETSLKLLAKQAQHTQTLSATAQLASQQQQWPLLEETCDLALQVNWHNDQIHFSQAIAHHDAAYRLQLEGQAKILEDTTEITFSPSEIMNHEHAWQIAPNNRITVGASWVRFQDWILSHGPQQVSIAGTLSANPNQALQLRIKDFSLGNFNVALKRPLAGTVNAAAQLSGTTLLQPWLESTVDVRQCAWGSLQIGDIHTETRWQADIAQLQLSGSLHRQQAPMLTMAGHYAPLSKDDSLQLAIQLAHTELALVQPLTTGVLSKLSGKVSGELHVTGTPQLPKLYGQLSVADGGVCVEATGAYYHLNSQVTCAGRQLTIDRLELMDDQQGKALLKGTIHCQPTQEVLLDIKGKLSKLKVLQLDAGKNRPFYGTSVTSGTLSLTGPADNLSLHLQAKTDAGSHIYIPVRNIGNKVVQEDFIHFITSESQREVAKHISPTVRLKGPKLTLVLEITPDMTGTIILNTTSGDTIQGKGAGTLTLKVAPDGVLSMVGSVEFLQGAYTLSLYQFLKKRFNITPGSRITWQGDIHKGMLSVQSTYEQHASIAPLLQSDSSKKDDWDKHRYPVEVVLDIAGALSAPVLLFDIRFVESVNNATIDVFQERIKTDSQYLMNQVISLIFFKKFFNDNLARSSQGSLGRSVSELLSHELSGLASSFSENLDIDADLDLTALNQRGVDGLRLKLSYSLFNGRLRVSSATSSNNSTKPVTDAERIIGDVTVEYLLTKDGRLRMKMYNKRLDSIAPKHTSKQFTGGVSLLYTRSFSRWQELFQKKK